MTTADAVDRETAWLTAYTPSDGLPALLKELGGPWDIVQAYMPRTPAMRKTSIYVTRQRSRDPRVAAQRKRPGYTFRLKLFWPMGQGTVGANLAEQEQRALDAAVDQLVQRIRGPIYDKTHGGAFLSVAEAAPLGGAEIDVEFLDPEHALTAGPGGILQVVVTYSADDTEIVN